MTLGSVETREAINDEKTRKILQTQIRCRHKLFVYIVEPSILDLVQQTKNSVPDDPTHYKTIGFQLTMAHNVKKYLS